MTLSACLHSQATQKRPNNYFFSTRLQFVRNANYVSHNTDTDFSFWLLQRDNYSH